MRNRERALEILLSLVGFSAVLVSALAVPGAGIGWDAGMHTYGALDFRSIPPGSDLPQAYESIFLNIEFYGVLIQWSADLLYALLGGQGTLSPGALLTYQLQAAVTLFLSVATASAVGVVIGYIFHSRVAGLFVWSTMLSLPLLMGLSVMNSKDMPTASGLLLVSAGASLLWAPASRRVLVAGSTFVGLGVFVSMSVRISSWMLVLAILAFSVTLRAVISLRQGSFLLLTRQIAAIAVGSVLGLLGVYALNPLARIDFAGLVWDSFIVSRAFDWVGTVRTLGQDVISTDLPWWYVPAWFTAQMPVLFLIFAVAACAFWFIEAAKELVRSMRPRTEGGVATSPALALMPFAVQGLAIPFGLVLLGATLYDGIRHIAFSVPAIVVLAAPLVFWLVNLGKESRDTMRVRRVVIGILVIAVPLSGLVASIRWFPFMYAHVNFVAAATDDDRDWEYDYWGTTIVEGVSRLRDMGMDRVVVSPPIDPTGSGEVLDVTLAEDVADDDEYGLYVFRRWYAAVPDSGCRRVFDISRGGVTLGEGAICQGSESLAALRRNVREPELSE